MKSFVYGFLTAIGCLASILTAFGNIPGGGDGSGSNVTLTDNGNGTVTLANGIVSIVCSKSSAVISQINYTFNNTGSPQTLNLLAGGHNGGQLYWEDNNNQGLTFSYSVVTDPTSNGGNYAEIALTTTTVANIVLEVHYSLLRGATGFYVTAIYAHRSTDSSFSFGECRDNIYAGAIFNWMSVDAQRNRLMEVSGGSSIGVYGAPKEVTLWTDGIYAGQYEDKYKYSADLGVDHVWGWSSVGAGGKNVGLWNVSASSEYYNGGPLKRELMEHIGTTILNMLNGGHYGQGGDGSFAGGEVWTKVCGPYFIYCNNVSSAITGTNAAAQLYSDALAQGAAEESAWPYSWFTNPDYAPASQRGVVTGQMVINDSGNPNASASNLWVGLVRQPATTTSTYDFQAWMKPYQFWAKTGANGDFTISNVIATNNYTLYAFGPGAPEIFMSTNQVGGSPPVLYDLPSSLFGVTVTGGATNHLGTVTWTPARVGATVFQIGYPDRTSGEFRHGDDWWVGDIGPDAGDPSPIWSKWLEYPFDFPSGPNYVVGQSRWTTDWNYVQPVVTSSTGTYNNSSSTITFDLASAPAGGAQASLYLGLSSDYYAAVIVSVNGHNLGGVSGVTGSPNNSIPTTGYYVGYGKSDTTIREGNQAMASDERITFPASNVHLQQGQNTITIGIRQVGGSYFADHAMYDYLRLELTGYVPPAPASVAAYPGNHTNLVCWPVTPGATSYNVLRSTTSGGSYSVVASGVVGPVCGSGPNNATYLDPTAANGTTYYYEVQSVNPNGHSGNSLASSGTMPGTGYSTSVPAAPVGVTVSSVGHQSVSLNWAASSGANYYTIYRSTLVANGGGGFNVLSTIVLANNVTGTSYTDSSPTDGSIYRYLVTATDAGGTSGDSGSAVGVPLPGPPSGAPASFSQTAATTNSISLSWSGVSDAVGYEIRRATSSAGPFAFLQAVTETTYTDGGLSAGSVYYYQVSAMNAGGVSTNRTLAAFTLGAPTSFVAIPGNAQVELTWDSSPGATSYVLERSTANGGPYTILGTTTNTSYPDTGLANGTTYYYVVYANTPFGQSPLSAQASATPSSIVLIGVTAGLPGTSVVKAVGPTLATSSPFDMNGGNCVALLFTCEGFQAGDVISATYAGQPMTLGVATNDSVQWSGIFYLINPATTSGQFVIQTTGSASTDGAYSAIALANVGGVAGADAVANSATSGTISLNYTTVTNGGLVLGACVNNGWSSSYPAPSFVSGNANQTLFGPTIVDSNDGHLHTYGVVSAPGAHTDVYGNPYQRNAYVTLAFDAHSTMSAAKPVINNFAASANNLIFSGSGGAANADYYLLGTTNLQTPLTNWTRLLTNHFDAYGNFVITNTIHPNWPQSFYRLELQ